jgi:hypothetical protein
MRRTCTRRPFVQRVAATLPIATVAAVALALGCSDINTDPHSVASIALDTIPFPAVVAHDSLRDSLGVARPLHATAYNPQGNALTSVPVRYRVVDSGAVADSVKGYVVADSARPNPVRVVAEAGGLQTMPDTLWVVPAPDSIAAQNPADTLAYSLSDSTLNVSTGLTVKVMHRNGTTSPAPVHGWLVSYRIVAPTDTLLAQLVGSTGSASRVTTTASDGTASLRVRIRPIRLAAPTDSVIVEAMARMRGAPITGAPVRFVLQVKPRS